MCFHGYVYGLNTVTDDPLLSTFFGGHNPRTSYQLRGGHLKPVDLDHVLEAVHDVVEAVRVEVDHVA